MPNITKLAHKAQKKAPVDLKALLGPLYYRYLSVQADREHQNHLSVSSDPNPNAPDHVLIVAIDALRPDFVPDVAPLHFERSIAPGTWTFPSVTSMQTGQLPHEHGAVAHDHPDDSSFALPKQFTGSPTLPAVLESAGYNTYLGSSFITPFLALRGWFESHRVYGDADVETVLSDYKLWRQNRERTYGYLQLGDLHAPIDPPNKYVQSHDVDMSLDGLNELVKYTNNYSDAPPGWREHRLRLYRAALDYVEDALEPLVENVVDDTLLVIIGDHGEAMWEHPERDQQFADSRPNYGVGHGGTPFDEVARVPVALNHPNFESQFQGGLPNGRDIPNTICAGLGIDEPEFGGFNWFNKIPEDRYTICEATRYGTERKAVYQGDAKVIRSETDNVTLDATVHENGGETFETLSDDTINSLLSNLPDSWDNMDIETDASAMVQDQLEALGYR
ncbi:sulfatase-like hydrolase/transferase [Haloarcula japonica]|uniref:Arylsulfatase A family protein n=1 Tax=Haloarcula japonica (strain ATCC 49778 / DSM 6131 / JCM 7785 / NBRC 101032 / NCIMB 13157 / TR-1) TaxID=1227453 RepID=M0LDF1_HALJT|nr:sulfatase-like hydrolase/transferase [Haloarcula japonica]EMA30464.1 arylsulfatase A family protein [Haloarcula japonica DSM 6131]